MGFLWCRRINSLCGEFYNKIKKDADADAVQQPNLRRSRVGVPVSLFFFCFFFCFTDFSASAKKKETDFYAALKLMFEFLLCYCLAQGR